MREMDDGARGWLFRTARDQFWRVAVWYDLDDLVQDGYFTYYRVQKFYPDVVDRPHIMRLFQISYMNHIHTLAKLARRTNATEVPAAEVDPFILETITEDELATLYTLMAQAPQAVQAALRLYSTKDGRRRLRSTYRIRKDGTRETLNERLCRLTGFDPGQVDLVTQMRQLFAK